MTREQMIDRAARHVIGELELRSLRNSDRLSRRSTQCLIWHADWMRGLAKTHASDIGTAFNLFAGGWDGTTDWLKRVTADDEFARAATIRRGWPA